MLPADQFKVNFFIVGFPKCGTTALANYLANHPNICFSSTKEPFFFCSDFPKRQVACTIEEYRRLFVPTADTLLLGEGTVCYVYSAEAMSQIKEHNPDAKLIFLIRNPIDLVASLHSNQLRVLDENIDSLETAWTLQEERNKGQKIPKTCREPFFLQYKEVASQGKYLQQVYNHFNIDQILVLQFEELVDSPEEIYKKTVRFLELPEFSLDDLTAGKNPNMAFKSNLAGELGKKVLQLTRNSTLQRLKQKMGIPNLQIENIIKSHSMLKKNRKAMPPEFRKKLAATFKDDLQLLSDITSLDLKHWTETP